MVSESIRLMEQGPHFLRAGVGCRLEIVRSVAFIRIELEELLSQSRQRFIVVAALESGLQRPHSGGGRRRDAAEQRQCSPKGQAPLVGCRYRRQW